ncbi:MAG: 5-formyltetrahydrofolate cyclo-ligase [Gammaproteobacteria bacterium]|nr:5-formyltetrahydrofolate cyclo-ligase [Gammaproteobacteria bacterium]
MSNPDHANLRKTLRARRRALPAARQRANSITAARALIHWGLFLRFDSLALYVANDGELDPEPLACAALRCSKSLFLPVLTAGREKQLSFAPYERDSIMVSNRFGIAEPLVEKRALRKATDLDVILLPLVGFDLHGNRLGMGGGYYDRTLAFLRQRKLWHRPLLIGLAHHCQHVATISPRLWDIPLDFVASERGVQRMDCEGRAARI